MKLFFQKLGQGHPIIILHGLYGSSDNWITIARRLADSYTIYLIDQRNHGRSPHDVVHSYLAMVKDLDEFISVEQIESPIIIGHSMGGKVAMLFASTYPERVGGLVVVDVGPGGYAKIDKPSSMILSHLNIISAMLSVDLKQYSSRTEIEQVLAKTLHDRGVLQFIMKNVQRNPDNTFSWKLNIDTLSKALPEVMGPVILNVVDKVPVYFIKGEHSGYISEDQQVLIARYFPNAKIEVISKSGHWVHADQPEQFFTKLQEILSAIQL